MSRVKIICLAFFAGLIFLSGCDSNGGSGQSKDQKSGQTAYDQQVAAVPAHSMKYPVTRVTINKWIDRWGSNPNKLSYVYFQNASGELTGYYVFKGLPVSYCVSLRPTYQFVGTPDDDSNSKNQQVPAPGADGVYYSGGGCNTYYGFDANTDAYVEYTAGLGINVLVYDQPLTQHPNVPKLNPGGK